MLVLSGVVVVIVGFAAGVNPLVVVTLAAFVAGWAAGMSPVAVLAAIGHATVASRFMAVAWLVLPVIGLLEREGLRERAQSLIARVPAATAGRLMVVYLLVRQVTAALGLLSLGGHATMVRPLIAPMAEAVEEAHGPTSVRARMLVRAHAAAVDNVGAFFGEDVFVAVGSVLLIAGVLRENGIPAEPVALALWAVPTAASAFLIHGVRLLLLDRQLRRMRGPAT
jgi:uncharacterized membrane protein